MTLEKVNELMVLCELEQSILCLGKIEEAKEGYFADEIENPRLEKFYRLQNKYHYGWYIARDDIDEQIVQINKFKEHILKQ